MAALNEHFFTNNELSETYRRIAGGASAPRLVNRNDGSGFAEWTDWGPGEGGLVAVRSSYIAPGTKLVRFGGLRDGRTAPLYFGEAVAMGAWWLEWVHFEAVKRYANTIGESVAYAMRQVCAIPKEWSDLSFYLEGTTRSPLSCWAGYGRSVESGGVVVDPLAQGKPRIEQYYIPGMWDPDLNKKAIFTYNPIPLDPAMSHAGARREQEMQAEFEKRMRGIVQPR